MIRLQTICSKTICFHVPVSFWSVYEFTFKIVHETFVRKIQVNLKRFAQKINSLANDLHEYLFLNYLIVFEQNL